jgi:ATP-dependent DNA helicase DinG
MLDLIKQAFSENSPLKEILEHYEVRPQQTEMAQKIYETLKNQGVLMVEAGTGVGKTLSYLLAAALWIIETNNKAVIATNTKVLQEQIIKKDLPILKKLLQALFKSTTIDIKWAVVYGQENYICKRRLALNTQYGLFDSLSETAALERLFQWLEKGGSGIIPECEYHLESIEDKIVRDGDICKYQKCAFYEECYYFKEREKWQQASLLITNHALFFANVQSQYLILPNFSAVIFDEAHRLEETAAHHFGLEISNWGLLRLFNMISNPTKSTGLLMHLKFPKGTNKTIDKINNLLNHARTVTDNFFTHLYRFIPSDDNKIRIKTPIKIENYLDPVLKEICDGLLEISFSGLEEDSELEVKRYLKRLETYRIAINQFLELSDKNSVYWIEYTPPVYQKPQNITLNSALIDIGELFQEQVIKHIPRVILTSATLTVNKSFNFIENRLGIKNSESIFLASPFDYRHQTLLVIPTNLPLPTEEELFFRAAAEAINEILEASRGRALILFTSYKALNRTYELIDKTKFPILVQGQEPSNSLMEKFRTETSSVLLATQSFWQGVDFPGETLSCLIIVRLPFDVPDSPRLEGICEQLREKHIEPFINFQLPNAVLRFRQGFGRLIRSKQDRGVICVLDKRIVLKEYGKSFILSLPPRIPLAFSINAVREFFSQSYELS